MKNTISGIKKNIKSRYTYSEQSLKAFIPIHEANIADIRLVITSFEQFCRARGVSVRSALADLKAKGYTISKQGLHRGKRGDFKSCNISWLNIMVVYMGFNGMSEFFRYLPREGVTDEHKQR